MWLWSKRNTSKSDNAAIEKRASERIETVVLSCDLGVIAEISRVGMRVRVEKFPGMLAGDERDVELSAPTDGMKVRVKVVRLEPLKGGRYDLGLEFVGMEDEQRQSVENLARHGRRRAPGAFSSEKQRDRVIAAMKMPDYYQALGVRARATDDEIHAAFRLLARKYHPDVCRDEGAVARFCLINDAHSTLGDAEKRAEYDALYELRPAA